jgi:hypothetical protein
MMAVLARCLGKFAANRGKPSVQSHTRKCMAWDIEFDPIMLFSAPVPSSLSMLRGYQQRMKVLGLRV